MSTPIITLILPVHNESAYIQRGLLAISDQGYPADCLAIITADGMSTYNTCSLIHAFSALHPQIKIEVLDNPGNIVPTGIFINQMNPAIKPGKFHAMVKR